MEPRRAEARGSDVPLPAPPDTRTKRRLLLALGGLGVATLIAALVAGCREKITPLPPPLRLEADQVSLGSSPVVRIDGPIARERGSRLVLLAEGIEWGSAFQTPDEPLEPGARLVRLHPPPRAGRYYVSLYELNVHRHRLWRWHQKLYVTSEETEDLQVSFILNREVVAPGEELMVSFDRPLDPRVGEHYELLVLRPGEKGQGQAGVRARRGATGAVLDGRKGGGSWQVILLARQPTEPWRTIYRQFFETRPREIEAAPPAPAARPAADSRLRLPRSEVVASELFEVRFVPPIFRHPRWGSYSIELLPLGVAEAEPGRNPGTHRRVLSLGQRQLTLNAPSEPGRYELRLLVWAGSERPMALVDRQELQVVAGPANR